MGNTLMNEIKTKAFSRPFEKKLRGPESNSVIFPLFTCAGYKFKSSPPFIWQCSSVISTFHALYPVSAYP